MLNSNSCIICQDSISDPVCRSCYLKQVKILLNDFEVHPIAKEIILRKIKRRFPVEFLNDTQCILCKKENVSMCRHCFSVILIDILRELNFTENLIEEFGFNPMNKEIFLEKESRLKATRPIALI
jgi:hypothetical protein